MYLHSTDLHVADLVFIVIDWTIFVEKKNVSRSTYVRRKQIRKIVENEDQTWKLVSCLTQAKKKLQYKQNVHVGNDGNVFRLVEKFVHSFEN